MDYKKQNLLDFPLGSNPPAPHTLLGQALRSFTMEGEPEYDPEFSEELRKRHPNWYGLPLVIPKPKARKTPNNIVIKKIKSEVADY